MTSLKIYEALSGINETLSDDLNDLTRRLESSIDDVGTRIGALESTIEQQSDKFISVIEEKNLSTEERSALEVIEKSLAERNFLESEAEIIARNITNNGFADLDGLEHSNVTNTLARKYALCSTELYFSSRSCGKCRMRIFATRKHLLDHVTEESAKQMEESTKKKRAFVESHPDSADFIEIDDDGFKRPLPRLILKRANKNVAF